MSTGPSDREHARTPRRGTLVALLAAVGRNRTDAARILTGSALSGVGAYGFHLIATRALEQDAFAPVGVLWTIQYLVTSVVLFAIEAHVLRSQTDRSRPDPGVKRQRA